MHESRPVFTKYTPTRLAIIRIHLGDDLNDRPQKNKDINKPEELQKRLLFKSVRKPIHPSKHTVCNKCYPATEKIKSVIFRLLQSGIQKHLNPSGA